MNDTKVSIGQVKRDISELVNRVAYGGERIVLTSRGRPKAVIVSLTDYENIKQVDKQQQLAEWKAWLSESEKLAAEILARRGGRLLDMDTLWEKMIADREARDEQIIGS